MGYMRHHAIVISGWQDAHLIRARAHALTIFREEMVSEVLGPVTNGVATFLIGPDGSKEGWDTSDNGDDGRSRMKSWLRCELGEGAYLDWVEVQYGDDDGDTRIVDHSDAVPGGESDA
jgi:hypothetical protein